MSRQEAMARQAHAAVMSYMLEPDLIAKWWNKVEVDFNFVV
jgi:hypothetical protein